MRSCWCWLVSLALGACTSAPANVATGGGGSAGPSPLPPPAAASPTAAEATSAVVAASAAASLTAAAVQAVATSSAGPIPDCTRVPPSGAVVELPPSDANVMNNASTDASVDRGYPELGPTLQRRLGALRCCYDAARRERPELAGSLVIEFLLAADGGVKSASHVVQKSDIKDPLMGACVTATLREITFPASRRGRQTQVMLPLVFRPRGGR